MNYAVLTRSVCSFFGSRRLSLAPFRLPDCSAMTSARLDAFARGAICALAENGVERSDIQRQVCKKDGTHPNIRAIDAHDGLGGSRRERRILAGVLLKDAVKDALSLGFGAKDVVEDASRSGLA